MKRRLELDDYFSKGVYLFNGNKLDVVVSLLGVLHLPSIKFLKLLEPLKLEKFPVLLKLLKPELDPVKV